MALVRLSGPRYARALWPDKEAAIRQKPYASTSAVSHRISTFARENGFCPSASEPIPAMPPRQWLTNFSAQAVTSGPSNRRRTAFHEAARRNSRQLALGGLAPVEIHRVVGQNEQRVGESGWQAGRADRSCRSMPAYRGSRTAFPRQARRRHRYR